MQVTERAVPARPRGSLGAPANQRRALRRVGGTSASGAQRTEARGRGRSAQEVRRKQVPHDEERSKKAATRTDAARHERCAWAVR